MHKQNFNYFQNQIATFTKKIIFFHKPFELKKVIQFISPRFSRENILYLAQFSGVVRN